MMSRVNLEHMKFDAKCLYENGQLLETCALARQPFVAGNFTFEDLNDFRHGRLIRKARLRDVEAFDTGKDVLPPLFDAEIVSVDADQMIVRGYAYTFGMEPIKERGCRQYWTLRAWRSTTPP
jgi:hypothetical protein